ncbi:LOW QUALITY PROTEIN: hypothetical protein HID58_040948 [Brassica napus]|uniref:Uncharacterized protein n=1 Tax=Brassica napus TaxID=3708 RepID=A0ABQ8B9G1_BRANA|nr:LOW QUALITY PROTEIN: hypothetical protein HID58_040948 [Brassica napus]
MDIRTLSQIRKSSESVTKHYAEVMSRTGEDVKRSKQLKTLGKNEDGGTSASVEGVQQGSGTSSQQQLLQSLFSGSSRGREIENMVSGGANSEGGGGFDLYMSRLSSLFLI